MVASIKVSEFLTSVEGGTLVAGTDVGLDELDEDPPEEPPAPVDGPEGGCAGWAGAHEASATAATINMEKIVTGLLLKSVLISCSFRTAF
jgi:hypothetical protein